MFTVYLNDKRYKVSFHHYTTTKPTNAGIARNADNTDCKIVELGKDDAGKFTVSVKEYVATVTRYVSAKKSDPYEYSKARKYSLTKALRLLTDDDKIRATFWTYYFLNHSYKSEGKSFFNYFAYQMPKEIFDFVSKNIVGDDKDTLLQILP